MTLQGGLENEVIGIEDSENDGFLTIVGLKIEPTVEGATPAQALAAVRAEEQESGMVACGGFAMPCAPSRQPFRFFADFIGADPRFRGGAVMSGEDGGFRAVSEVPVKVSQGEADACDCKQCLDCEAADYHAALNVANRDTPVFTASNIDWNGASLTLPAGSTISGTLTYPDGNPKTAAGAKKPDLSVVPPVALLHLATAMMNGAEKYGPFNWRDQPISYRPYLAAAMRHLASCLDGEDFSADTVAAGLPVHHLGHVMACCAIVLDATHCGTITDNRPTVPGQTGAAIELYNVEKKLLPTPQSA